MSGSGGLRVCLGDPQLRADGGLPFADDAVAVLALGAAVADRPRPALVRLLLECRRVLAPGGLLSVDLPAGADEAGGKQGVTHNAALVGLVPAAGAAGRREYSKPERRVAGEPPVSIVIPAYTPRFFASALDSALAQTYRNLEIVVCDDSGGSEIEALCRGRQVRYLRNATRLRPRGNFIRCFEEARGEFVKILCDDDLLAPNCVESLVDTFRRAPGVTLAASRRRRIDEQGNGLADQPATMPPVAGDATIAGYTLVNAMLMAGLNMVGEPSTVLFRKADLLDQAPDYFRFDGEHGRGIIDMVTWAALLLKGDAVYRAEPLSSFRVHAGQRQRDPATRQLSIASIRGLQAAWLELRLFEAVPPHLLLAKPFPPPADAGWRLQAVASPFAVRPTGSLRNFV